MGRTTRRRGSVIPEGTVTMLLTDVEGSTVLVCLSGRGDKDLDTIRTALEATDA